MRHASGRRWAWLAAFALLSAGALPAAAKAAKKPAKADEKAEKAEAKPAVAPPGAPAAAPAEAKSEPVLAPVAAVPELPERVIEKRVGEYLFRLTMVPGNLKPGRVADLSLEVARVLDIPDPTTGDRAPVQGARPVATVQAPAPPALPPPPPPKGKKAPPPPPAPVAPPPVRFSMWPLANPGSYGFHFTPADEGLYTVGFKGQERRGEDEEPLEFEASFRLGAGAAATQTEQSQGSAAARRSARRPVGPGTAERAAEDKLQKLMAEIGHRFLDLDALVAAAPAKGPWADVAARARELGAAFAGIKGLVPASYASGGGEFDRLAAAMGPKLEEIAAAAETGKDAKALRAAWEPLEGASCLQCHAKYRFGVTTDLGAWPKFQPKPWKK